MCKPKCLGGLGISDLRRTGVALRVRWVCRDRAAGRAPRTKERAVLALFQAATIFTLGNGESTYFWTGRWINGESIQSSYGVCSSEEKEEEGDRGRSDP